jgi:hypothetical protein
MRLLGKAAAAPGDEAPVLFIFNMVGGYNALFASADSFISTGAFGVNSSNVRRIGTSNLYVDGPTLGTLSAPVLNKMASVGIAHGLSGHTAARLAMLFQGTQSRLVKLSSIMPSTAAVRCVAVGENPGGIHPAIGNVSLQLVRDLSTTVTALGGTTTTAGPKRAPSAKAMRAAEAMAEPLLTANPASATSLRDGYAAAAGQLEQPTNAIDYAALAAAYGITAGTGGSVPTVVSSTVMQIMGCELMIHAGANVVVASQHGWDSHQDNDGSEVRDKLLGVGTNNPNKTMAALQVFTQRTMAMTNRNVVTVIMGEFSRSLPGSNHQPNLTATVIGKRVKLGTTGRVDSDVGLPAGTPGIEGFWAYLAAVLRAPGTPFGANPHTSILLP